MIISIAIVSLELSCTLEESKDLIVKNLDSDLISWEINQNGDGHYIFTLIKKEEPLIVGGLAARSVGDKSTELTVLGRLVQPEDGRNDERFFILRSIVKDLFSFFQMGKNIISDDELKKSLSLLEQPITPSEREKLDQIINEQEKQKAKDGFYSRSLFDAVCKTKPANVLGILNRYRIDKLREGNHFWEMIQIREARNIENTYTYELNHQASGIFGLFGQIEVTPSNKKKAVVKLITASDIIPFVEEQDARRLYFIALDEMQALAKYLSYAFSVNNEAESSIPPSSKISENMNKKVNSQKLMELIKVVQANSNNRQEQIDGACIVWADRDSLLNGMTLPDFLILIDDETKLYVTESEFQRALRDAYSRKLIDKINGRWRPKQKMQLNKT